MACAPCLAVQIACIKAQCALLAVTMTDAQIRELAVRAVNTGSILVAKKLIDNEIAAMGVHT